MLFARSIYYYERNVSSTSTQSRAIGISTIIFPSSSSRSISESLCVNVCMCVCVSLERFQPLTSRRVSRYGRKRGYDRDNANTDPARSDSWSLGDLTIDLCLGIVYRSNWKWPDTLRRDAHSVFPFDSFLWRRQRSSRSRNRGKENRDGFCPVDFRFFSLP